MGNQEGHERTSSETRLVLVSGKGIGVAPPGRGDPNETRARRERDARRHLLDALGPNMPKWFETVA